MIDHHEARLWADHHFAFSDTLAALYHQALDAFAALARINYDRPWGD